MFQPLALLTTFILLVNYPPINHHILMEFSRLKIPPQITSQVSSGQVLPIGAHAKIAGRDVKLEVTRTVREQALGLMYRTSLADDRGMLFSFNPPQNVRFWMKNCRIPLDMVFLKDGVVKYIAPNVPPCQKDPCPHYGPTPAHGLIDQVIELRGGWVAEYGLKVGSVISLEFLDPKYTQ